MKHDITLKGVLFLSQYCELISFAVKRGVCSKQLQMEVKDCQNKGKNKKKTKFEFPLVTVPVPLFQSTVLKKSSRLQLFFYGDRLFYILRRKTINKKVIIWYLYSRVLKKSWKTFGIWRKSRRHNGGAAEEKYKFLSENNAFLLEKHALPHSYFLD